MDFHIDKKMGLLLTATFILGGLIGGLAGIATGHEGHEWRDGRGRGSFGMMGSSRFGNDFGDEAGTAVPRLMMRRNVQQNTLGADARTVTAPAAAAPAAPATEGAPVQ